MKLYEARKIGHECGLITDAECIANVELHATSLFEYSKMETEIKELYDDTPNSKELMSEYWFNWGKRNGTIK